MSNYDRYTNYKDNAGVSGVVFGANKTVLEVELNEMQEIQKTHMRNVLHSMIGDGTTNLSSIKYTGGKLTVTNSMFSVDGIVVQCDSLSLSITNGSAYLQVWEEDADYTSILKKNGNQQSTETVSNWFKDTRSIVETTRRKVVRYNLTNTTDPTKHNLKIADFSNGVMTLVVKETDIAKAIQELQNQFDNLQIGGRNLAKETNQGSKNWSWSLETGSRTVESELIDGIDCVKLTKTEDVSASGWNMVYYKNFERNRIKPNTEYVLSFEVKSNKVSSINANLTKTNGTDYLTETSKVIQGKVEGNDTWTKVVFLLKTYSELPTTTDQVIYLRGFSVEKGAIHYIRNLMLEEGNKPSDWTPAPEDFQDQIDKKLNKTEFDNLQIGGRNLYTGTKDFSGTWKNSSLWTTDGEYKGFTVKTRSANWGVLCQERKVYAGEVYTCSLYIKIGTLNNFQFYPDLGGLSLKHSELDRNVLVDKVNTWTRIHKTIKVLEDGIMHFGVEPNTVGGGVWICGMMLENSTKPTDWTPAIEDLVNINKITDRLDVTEDGFVLSGKGGKSLQDQITEQNKNINAMFPKQGGIEFDSSNKKTANHLLYYIDNENWCGLGCNSDGSFAVRVGVSDIGKHVFKVKTNGSITFDNKSLVTNSDIPHLNIKMVRECNILDYIKQHHDGTMKYWIVRGFECSGSPSGAESNDFIYQISHIDDIRFIRVTALDVRTKEIYYNAMIDESWVGWSNNDDASTLQGLTPDQILTKGGKHLAGQGVDAGYSFTNDGVYDTGMFSDSDGDLYFMRNGTRVHLPANDGSIHQLAFTDSTVSNADLLAGHGESHFVRTRDYGGIDVGDPKYPCPYMVDVSNNSSMPDTDWWHVIYVPHSSPSAGYGSQIAIGFHGNPRTFIRTANGTSWGGWRMMGSSSSAPVAVRPDAPSGNELWAW